MTELKPLRVAVATALTDREKASSGTYTTDTMLTNCYVEKNENGKVYVVKRPGYTSGFTYNGGASTSGQGATFYKGMLWVVGSNVLYRLTGSVNGSADGTAWSSGTVGSWQARGYAGCVVFQGQVWILGGESSGFVNTYFSDVWASSDMVNWSQITSSAPWGARSRFGCVVFGNTLYVIGGLGASGALQDVWSTTDGVNWVQVVSSANWSARWGMGAVASNQGIFIMGGAGSAYFNDVWFSPDGTTWSQLAANAGWSIRALFSCLMFNNKLWMAGGTNGVDLQDVWSSVDGVIWTNTGNLPAIRSGMASTVYSGKMWFIGGSSTTTVWSSTDGSVFTVVTAAYGGAAETAGSCVTFPAPASVNTINADTIWLMGGVNAPRNGVYFATLNVAIASSFSIGTTGSTSLQFQFETQDAGRYLILKNTADAWVVNAGILQKITSPNYPASTVPGVVNLDDTLYVMDAHGVIYGSNLSDPFTWSALNFIQADYESDTAVAIKKYQNYIVAFKSLTMQLFQDAGRFPGSPLVPVKSATSRVGCVSAGSIVSMDNSLVFMAQNSTIGRYIAVMNGETPQRISTTSVERILNSWIPDNGIYSFAWRPNGHDWYVISLSSRGITLAYDFQYQTWFTMTSASTLGIFRGINYVTDGSVEYIQDVSLGFIYNVSPNFYTDNGDTITCTGTTDKVDGGNNERKFCTSLTVIGDRLSSTSPNTLTIKWSDDDAQTFNTGFTVDLTKPRPRINRLGSFRRRQFRYIHAANNPMRLEALELEVA